MKTIVNLKYFGNDCLWKYLFAFNSPQNPSNLIFFRILLTLKPFAEFLPKIKAIKLQKNAKICPTWYLLFRSFH